MDRVINQADYQHFFLPLLTQAEQSLIDVNMGIKNAEFSVYLTLWEEIAQKTADFFNNNALQDIILLFVDANSQAFNDAQQLTPRHNRLLHKWHLRFKDYIQAPEDENNAVLLIECLNAEPLSLELTEDDQRVLLASFIPAIGQLNNEAFDEIKPKVVAVSIWEKIAPVFAEVDVILQAILTADLNIEQTFLNQNLRKYQWLWTDIAQLIEYENDAVVLFDSVLLFNKLCQQLIVQQPSPNYEQLALLKRWHNLFTSYIKTHGSVQIIVALIKCLTHSSWPQPISKAEEQNLLVAIGIVENVVNPIPKVDVETHLKPVNIISPITMNNTEWVLLDTLIWQRIKPLFEQSMLYLSTAMKQQQEMQLAELKLTLQHYLEQWLIIAQELQKQSHYDGLLDLIFLFIEIGSQAFSESSDFEAQSKVLSLWQHNFAVYLQTDEQHAQQAAWALIQCLSDAVWGAAAITEADEQMLAEGMQPTSTEEVKHLPLVIETHLPIVAEVATQVSPQIAAEPVAAPTVSVTEEESLLELIDLDEDSEAILGLDLADEAQLGEVEALDELEEIVNFSIPDFSLAQEYEDIWQELESVFQQAQTNLQTVLDDQQAEDTAGFHFDLQCYVENWQEIADILVRDERYIGFSDVVVLFVEMSIHAFVQQTKLNDWQIQLLKQWQHFFSDYFTQYQHTAALALVHCLTDAGWGTAAITEADEQLLLEGLHLPAVLTPMEKIAQLVTDTEKQLATLTALLSMNNAPACGVILQDYIQNWTTIAQLMASVENAQLAVMADIGWLFVEACSHWLQNPPLRENDLPLLQDWQTAFAGYLNDATILPLLLCLENPHWAQPLTQMDRQLLLDAAQSEICAPVIAIENTLEAAQVPEKEDAVVLTIPPPETQVAPVVNAIEEPEDVALEASIAVDEAIDVTEPVPEVDDTERQLNLQVLIAATAPSHVNLELVGMVRDEFDNLVTELFTEIAQSTDLTTFRDIVNAHQFKMQSLAKASQTVGLLGLESVFTQLSLNMRSRRETDPDFTPLAIELFKNSLLLVQDYFNEINNLRICTELVYHLTLAGWRHPLAEVEVNPLIALLVTPLIVDGHKEELSHRKTTATLADMSLKIPDDVNKDLLDSLLSELPLLTSNFSAVIQRIIFMAENDVQQLLDAQRIAHTLKGSGNIVGVTGIAVLTHHLEEILEYLTDHKKFPTKALGNVLLESADCLEMLCELMLNGESQAPEQALAVLQNVLNWANQIAAQGLPAEDVELATTVAATLQTAPAVEMAKVAEPVAMLRVPSELVDSLLRASGEANILSEQFKDKIGRFSEELKNLNGLTWSIQSLVAELDQFINIQSYSVNKLNRSLLNTPFDALEMEQYNELHTAASRIAEVATDIRETTIGMEEQLIDLRYLMIEESNMQRENQDKLQSIRMVPASTIASRCQRIVRQACRATNKEVELEIQGADILIDSEILNDMVDPLMHLLRNSVDHGIEPVHIREQLNKNTVGKIVLGFKRKGNYAVISCKDDGSGLASDAILQTAIKKGLISPEQELTEAEIHKLILIPGFSTRAVVTQTSGRGIGMDAIQSKISSIQGQMSLVSVRGEGLSIEITIPLTLSSMLSLLVKCNGQTMAISNRGLRKIYHADECTLVKTQEHLWCDIDYERYAAKYFAELVGMPLPVDAEKKLPAVRIEDEIGKTRIVFIDELLGYHDLLVKHMGSYIPHIQGVTGASILGNGDVAPVIDLVEMLHHAVKYEYVMPDATKALADNIHGLPVALVVDDSLSARRAVATLLKDCGIQVETAIDGLDAIKQIEKILPDLLVVDLEMPRMNGIELAAHIRGREDMKETPIIMITSRATEKHRKQAEAAGVSQFMTKPFTEDDLIHQVKVLLENAVR